MSAPGQSPQQSVSVRQFAKLDGCDEALVRRAIRNGKLKAEPDGTVDPALAGSGWRRSNRNVATPPAAAPRVAVVEPTAPPAKPASQLAERVARDIGSLLDGELADQFLRQVLSGDFAELAEAERIKENGLALKHLLDARRKAGALIERDAAEEAFFRTARDNRDAWMGWVARVAVTMAAELEVDARQLAEVLTRYVHQHLTELGEPDFEPVSDPAEG